MIRISTELKETNCVYNLERRTYKWEGETFAVVSDFFNILAVCKVMRNKVKNQNNNKKENGENISNEKTGNKKRYTLNEEGKKWNSVTSLEVKHWKPIILQ